MFFPSFRCGFDQGPGGGAVVPRSTLPPLRTAVMTTLPGSARGREGAWRRRRRRRPRPRGPAGLRTRPDRHGALASRRFGPRSGIRIAQIAHGCAFAELSKNELDGDACSLDDRLARHRVRVELDAVRPLGGSLRERLLPLYPPSPGERPGDGPDGFTPQAKRASFPPLARLLPGCPTAVPSRRTAGWPRPPARRQPVGARVEAAGLRGVRARSARSRRVADRRRPA